MATRPFGVEMTRVLDIIVTLQRELVRLGEARRRLDDLPDWMRELHAEHTVQAGEIEAAEAAARQAALDRRTAEGSVLSAQEKLKHFQQQIGMVRTQREYGALLHEIDAARQEIRRLEETALEALERGEAAQQEITEKRAAFADLDQRYRSELERWNAEKPSLLAGAADLEARVQELRSQVPPVLLSRFQRLLDRNRGEALAAVRPLDRHGRVPQLWACGGCNYRVRPQIVVEIRNQGSIVECDSCKRILYLESSD